VFSYTVIWGRGSTRSSTLLEYASCVAVWRKAHPPFVSRNTEVKSTLQECALRVAMWRKPHPVYVRHCWSLRYESQPYDKLIRLS